MVEPAHNFVVLKNIVAQSDGFTQKLLLSLSHKSDMISGIVRGEKLAEKYEMDMNLTYDDVDHQNGVMGVTISIYDVSRSRQSVAERREDISLANFFAGNLAKYNYDSDDESKDEKPIRRIVEENNIRNRVIDIEFIDAGTHAQHHAAKGKKTDFFIFGNTVLFGRMKQRTLQSLLDRRITDKHDTLTLVTKERNLPQKVTSVLKHLQKLGMHHISSLYVAVESKNDDMHCELLDCLKEVDLEFGNVVYDAELRYDTDRKVAKTEEMILLFLQKSQQLKVRRYMAAAPIERLGITKVQNLMLLPAKCITVNQVIAMKNCKRLILDDARNFRRKDLNRLLKLWINGELTLTKMDISLNNQGIFHQILDGLDAERVEDKNNTYTIKNKDGVVGKLQLKKRDEYFEHGRIFEKHIRIRFTVRPSTDDVNNEPLLQDAFPAL